MSTRLSARDSKYCRTPLGCRYRAAFGFAPTNARRDESLSNPRGSGERGDVSSLKTIRTSDPVPKVYFICYADGWIRHEASP